MRIGMGDIVFTNFSGFMTDSHEPIAIVLWAPDPNFPRILHVVGTNGREIDISSYNIVRILTEKELDADVFLTAHPRFLASYKILRNGEKKK